MNDLFSVGSPVVVGTLLALIFLSVVTWSIALFKLWKQIQDGKRKDTFNDAFWAAHDWNAAADVAKSGEGDLARLAQAGFAELKNLNAEQQDLQHIGAPQEVLERMLRQQVQNIQRYHERGLSELATIGSTAPFIGLFGTVWGIMHAFQSIAQSKNTSLAVVAPGIAEALFATALGLLAAIPAVLAYNKISRDLDRYASRLDGFAVEFSAILSRMMEEKASR